MDQNSNKRPVKFPYHKNRNKFIIANRDLDLYESGVKIIIEDQNITRLSVMILVDEETTSENIRKAIPQALKWRDRLLLWQGPSKERRDIDTLIFLDQQHQHGFSYAKIAEDINFAIASLIKGFYKFAEECIETGKNFKTIGDYLTWLSRPDSYEGGRYRQYLNIIEAKVTLRNLRFSEDEAMDWLRDGLDRIREGKEPFDKKTPVSRSRIIDLLRDWREKKDYQTTSKPKQETTSQQESLILNILSDLDPYEYGLETFRIFMDHKTGPKHKDLRNDPWSEGWFWETFGIA